MNKRSVILALLAAAIVVSAAAQTGQAQNAELFLQKLKSPDFKVREDVVHSLVTLGGKIQDERLVLELIELYKMEIERDQEKLRFANRPGRFEDVVPYELQYTNTLEFAHYYLALSGLVAETKRPEVLPLLVDHALDAKFLKCFGDDAVGPVIRVLETTGNESKRLSALRTLTSFYADDGDTFGQEAKAAIFLTIQKSAEKDSDHFLRSSAVQFLGEHGDLCTVPLLERIAKTDAYQFETIANPMIDQDAPAGAKIAWYPVRNAARKAVEAIKKRILKRPADGPCGAYS
jgi:hypothetical protein